MLAEETNRRQSELNKYIFDMAGRCFEENEIRKMALFLTNLYALDFRHNYSEFFPLILDIAKDDSVCNLDYPSNNMEALRAYVEEDFVSGGKEFTELYAPLTKLSDHLNLEIGRYNHYSINEQKISYLEKRSQVLQVELSHSTSELINAKDKMSTIQTELIAVLSIFAAIVLSFSGGLSFMGNALNGITSTPFFQSVFFVILCGMVLFNTIFLMMYMVGKIIGRNIYAHCKSDDCSCGEDGQPKCHGVNRIRKRLPYVFWFNATLVLLITLDIALWILNNHYGFVAY